MGDTPELLTAVELELMLLLWSSGGASAREVLDRLPPDRERAYTSVSTILRILEQKGFVQTEKVGRRHRYVPTLSRASYERRKLRHLVGSLFGGDPMALVRRLVQTDDLSRAELEAARALIAHRLDDAGDEE